MSESSSSPMEYVRLGNCGLKTSRAIVGCMSYGTPDWQEWVLDQETALPLLKHAYDQGLNTWDTADVYSNGVSEEIIGKAIKKYNIPRHRLVILTKCYHGVADDGTQPTIAELSHNDGIYVNRQGLSRKHIFDAVDDSVRRLGTYIDVLQIHRLPHDVEKEEIMRALNDVVESGKVRYIGASSMAAWEFQMLQSIAEKHGWHKFISMQGHHSLIYREEEREMIPFCKATGIGLIPWSPIARGVLARPYGDRSSLRDKSDNYMKSVIRSQENEAEKTIINRVEELAKKHGVSMATIAIAWSIMKGNSPILGLNKKERIDEAVKAIKFASDKKLSEDDIKYLEERYVPRTVQGYRTN